MWIWRWDFRLLGSLLVLVCKGIAGGCISTTGWQKGPKMTLRGWHWCFQHNLLPLTLHTNKYNIVNESASIKKYSNDILCVYNLILVISFLSCFLFSSFFLFFLGGGGGGGGRRQAALGSASMFKTIFTHFNYVRILRILYHSILFERETEKKVSKENVRHELWPRVWYWWQEQQDVFQLMLQEYFACKRATVDSSRTLYTGVCRQEGRFTVALVQIHLNECIGLKKENNKSSVESQKGVNGVQRSSIENQKGVIALQSLWQ